MSAWESRARYMGECVSARHVSEGGKRDAPLSGEWADDVSPRDVFAYALGRFPSDSDDDAAMLDALCDAFESGYQA